MPAAEGLHDAFVKELRDTYDAEKQLIKALPKMAKAVNSEELRAAIEKHPEVTRGQVEGIEQGWDEAAGDVWLIRAIEGANAVAAEAKKVSKWAWAGAVLSTVVAMAALLKSFGLF